MSRGKQTWRFIGFPATACSELIGVVLRLFRQASMKAVNLAESAGIYSEIVDSFGLEKLQVSICVRTHLRVCKCSYPNLRAPNITTIPDLLAFVQSRHFVNPAKRT